METYTLDTYSMDCRNPGILRKRHRCWKLRNLATRSTFNGLRDSENLCSHCRRQLQWMTENMHGIVWNCEVRGGVTVTCNLNICQLDTLSPNCRRGMKSEEESPSEETTTNVWKDVWDSWRQEARGGVTVTGDVEILLDTHLMDCM